MKKRSEFGTGDGRKPVGHSRFYYTLGKGGVREGGFSWLQAATSPLDATKYYTLHL